MAVENEDKHNWYVFKTALGELEETIAIYQSNDFSYHIYT